MSNSIESILLNPRERLDYFLGGALKMIQSQDYFSSSVDAVLLAHFMTIPRRSDFRLLDFCSGNGIIPLLVSYRTQAPIEAIEIQAELVAMAQRNAQINQREHQITFRHGDLKEFAVEHLLRFDAISCNPPYFVVDKTEALHQKPSVAMARHEVAVTVEDWVKQAGQLLKHKGRLYIVHRPERLDDLFDTLLRYHFSVHRIQFIHPKPDRNANGVLMEAIYHGGRNGVRVEPPMVVHQANGDYTEAMLEIYQHG